MSTEDPDRTVDRDSDPDDATLVKSPEEQARLAGPGVTIPGYEIECELKRGGMGVVYRARQAGLNRTVALKMILAGPYADPGMRARFLLEAESIAALEHPHVVKVFAFGEHAGHPYLAMEFLPGGTLADLVKAGGPLPAREATEHVAKLAAAVAHAHSRGVVHRDIKPANVLLTADGEPRLADFGLAKVGRSDLTGTGQALGTPSYMSPEQAAGKTHEVGTPADVYALGAVLYDLLTGRPPFAGDSVAVTLQKVISEEPERPRKLNVSIPRDLETICLKCLEKEPGKRYPTGQSLADDLNRYLRGEPISVRPTGPLERGYKWVKRNKVVSGAMAAVALALVLAGVTAVVTAAWREAESAKQQEAGAREIAEEERGRAAVARDEALQAGDLLATANATLDRTNKSLVAAGQRETGLKAEIEFLNYAHLVQLAMFERRANNFGRARAHLETEQCPVRLRGWEWHYAHRLCHPELVTIPFAGTAVFTPDRARILTGVDETAAEPNVWEVWDAVSGRRCAVGPKGYLTSNRSLSPDGSMAVTYDGGTVRVWKTDTGKELTVFKAEVKSAEFNHDGKRIVTRDTDGAARIWDTMTGKLLATFPADEGAAVWKVEFDRIGRVLTVGGNQKARLWPADGQKQLAVIPALSATFSPDGRMLAWVENDKAQIWSADGQRLLATIPDGSATFSPDGTLVLSTGIRSEPQLWEAGTGKRVAYLLLEDELEGRKYRARAMSFSPNGRKVVTGHESGTVAIWDVPSDKPVTVLKGHGKQVTLVSFNPDGTRVMSASEDGTVRLWDAKGGRQLALLSGHDGDVRHAEFSSDGRRILTTGRDKTVRVWSTEPKTVPLVVEADHTSAWYREDGPAGRPVLVIPGAATVRLHDLITKSDILELPPEFGGISQDVRVGPNCRRILTRNKQGVQHVWDGATGQLVSKFEANREGKSVACANFDPHAKRVVTANYDRTASIWDAETGRHLVTLPEHKGPVIWAGFDPEGTRVLTLDVEVPGKTGHVRVWNAQTGKLISELNRSYSDNIELWFCPTEAAIVIRTWGGFEDETKLETWNLDTGDELAGFEGHTNRIRDGSFDRAGSKLITASDDGTARIWDWNTAKTFSVLKGHSGFVSSAAFDPTGTRAVTVDDKKVRLWDMATGKEMAVLDLPEDLGGARNVAFSRDGWQIIVKLEMLTSSAYVIYDAFPVNRAFAPTVAAPPPRAHVR